MCRYWLDKSQLCIRRGNAARGLYSDAYVMNDDGNKLDAQMIAAVTTLKNVFYDNKKDTAPVDSIDDRIQQLNCFMCIMLLGRMYYGRW